MVDELWQRSISLVIEASYVCVHFVVVKSRFLHIIYLRELIGFCAEPIFLSDVI